MLSQSLIVAAFNKSKD